MSVDRVWRMKAQALLLPTPLVGSDPGGEAAREAQLRALLGLDAPTQEDRELLAAARSDATKAEGGLGGVEALLRHPLSAEELSEVSQADLQAAWERFVGGLVAGEDWKNLYLRFADEQAFWQVPHAASRLGHSVAAHRILSAALVGARVSADGDAALLVFQVGPVQPFIEFSRRTRDLWAGSYLMSLMCAVAAKELCEKLGPEALLSPRVEVVPVLRQLYFGCDEREDALLQPALPAKVLALVPQGRVQELGDACVKRVKNLWDSLGEKCVSVVEESWLKAEQDGEQGPLPSDWNAKFSKQMDAFLERGWTALPWPRDVKQLKAFEGWIRLSDDVVSRSEAGEFYGTMSGGVWALHSAAKRSALPHALTGDARFKCTQCGKRECVGPVEENEAFWKVLRAGLIHRGESLEIRAAERLCAVCLSKRLGVEPLVKQRVKVWNGDYPSIPDIAVAPFRKRMKPGKEVDAFSEALCQLRSALFAAYPRQEGRMAPAFKGLDVAEHFIQICPGVWFDEDAYTLARIREDLDLQDLPAPTGNAESSLTGALSNARTAWLSLARAVGAKPSHYVAALYLDGDQISKWLNGTHDDTPTYDDFGVADGALKEEKRPVTPALQGELSKRLTQLAAGIVREVVEGPSFGGKLVYCGGDDVVALLPLEHAIPCADAIAKRMQEANSLSCAVTVSAGICVQHQREPLQRLLRGARETEKKAKDSGRDRVCVRLIPRSGAQIEVSLPWAFGHPTQPRSADVLEGLVKALGDSPTRGGGAEALEPDSLSQKLAHLLRAEGPRFQNNPELLAQLLLMETGVTLPPQEDWAKIWDRAHVPVCTPSTQDDHWAGVLQRGPDWLRLPLHLLATSQHDIQSKQLGSADSKPKARGRLVEQRRAADAINLLLLARFLARERLPPGEEIP